MKAENEFEYECPLLKEIIDDGLCLEINYEYLNMFTTKILEERSISKKNAENTCLKCKHYPL